MSHLRQYLLRHLYQLAILAIILITLLAMLMMNSLRLRLSSEIDEAALSNNAQYHFVLIAEQIDSPYWLEVYAGARAAADEVGAVVELAGSENFSPDQSVEQIQIATAAHLDGIATCVVDTVATGKAINLAVQADIPVVTLEYDASASQRQSFIGVNSYDLGQKFGQIAVEQMISGQIVILVSDDPQSTNLSENQIVGGLRDYLGQFPTIGLVTLEISRNSVFSAEQSIQELLINNPSGVSTIISLNVEDTLRVVEVLIDYGRANTVNVMGYQENADVLDYVQSGLIQTVIASDPYQIGYDSILALAELKTNNRTSEYVPSDLVVINQDNIMEYQANANVTGEPQ
ncbi:MAG: substrate-binding domain-containing protein [Eubacteriales bacterium]|nr:substrate-binding domain-containing protein [Eubacteriales bacterium]